MPSPMPPAKTSLLMKVGAGLYGPRHHSRRVAAFLVGVVVLSLGDLYMTLLHLLNFGMLESNPVARMVIEHGSPAALIIWKLVTVGFAVGVLYWARRRWTAEAGAAFCCLILTWLTIQWASYSDQIGQVAGDVRALGVAQEEPRWVTMAPGS